MRTKVLIIDDSALYLQIMRMVFGSDPSVDIVECHSKGEAMAAISRCQPAILFLDHNLTHGGDEGIQIADELKESSIKIYSTTETDEESVVRGYESMGIKILGKKSILPIKEIIESN